jgi:hypothetical protein
MVAGLTGKHVLKVVLLVFLGWLVIPAAAHAAANDLGVTQTLSATKAKPGGTVKVTSTVTNVGTETVSEAFVELAVLKGKILVFGTKDPYTSFSSSQGSCAQNSERGVTPEALVCSLGSLAPGQSAQIHASIRVRESAVQTTTLLPKPGENEYSDDAKPNNAGNQPFYLNVPPTVSGSKQLKLVGLPKGCVTGDFTLTARSKAPDAKKMRINLDLGFDKNGRHLLFKKEVRGAAIKMKVPASRAEFQIDEGAFPSYTLIVKTQLGGNRALKTTIKFKRC